jgi:DNA-binding transcriptional LysR family regulator
MVEDLRDLDAFRAVARHKSFRFAALELRVSVSGLSQRLRDLEQRLGVRLLNRTTRSVAPTEAGEDLLRKIGPALDELSAAVAATRERSAVPRGRLRISAPTPAIDLVLAPMLPPFLARYPEINLEVFAETALVDIVARGYDAGIRWEEHLAQDMVAVPLGPPQRYAVAASPSFLAEHGTPEEPSDLLGKPMIGVRFSSGVMLPWEFEKDGRTMKVSPAGPLTTNRISLQLAAAEAGVGFLGTFDSYLSDAVAAGRLVRVLDDWCQPFSGPLLYFPSRHRPPAPLAAFVGFVREWVRKATG